MLRYLSNGLLPQVELVVNIRHDLIVHLGLDDPLHFDVHKVVERVNVLFEEASDLEEGRNKFHLFLHDHLVRLRRQ